MNRSIVKLKFTEPLHLGNRLLSEGQYEIKSDTIFSALCIESGNIERVLKEVKENNLKISNAFPFIDAYNYLPKPMIHIEQKEKEYKLFKKIQYITDDMISSYLAGDMDPKEELEMFILGDADVRTQVRIGGDPFQVGIYTFKENAGLYIIVEHENDYIFDIFERLQYSGIGGKRSSGFGRFKIEIEKCFDFEEGEKKILLNSAMAKNDEIEKSLKGANYLLEKRSGFIHQSNYKKRDFYSFKAGSVFDNIFEGDVFDVGNDEHPVYQYSIPMFMGIDI